MTIPTGEFNFPLVSTVVFGKGSATKLKEKAIALGGHRAVIVTGNTLATKTPLVDLVRSILGDIYAGTYSGVAQHVPRESVLEGARMVKNLGADILISLGGSSTADAAKAINIVQAEGDDFDSMSVRHETGRGVVVPALNKPKLPQIAIPTTLSGGEFGDGAGVMNTRTRIKLSLRDPKVTPKVVILDPEMTAYTGPILWGATGLKVFSDCFEAVCSPRHQPFVDALALHAARIINRNLVRSIGSPVDLEARAELQHAAWMAMYGRRNIGGGVASPLRHQIGAGYNVAHGVASAIVFPLCQEFGRPAADERLALLAEALDLPAKDTKTPADAAINRIKEIIAELGLPSRLRDVGIPRDGLKAIAESSFQDMVGTGPKPASSSEELLRLLEAAW